MDTNAFLMNLPPVDEVLKGPQGQKWLGLHPRRFVLSAIRQVLDDARREIRQGGRPALGTEALYPLIEKRIKVLTTPSLRRVINATGIVLHTNLGRAPLSNAALENIIRVSKGYSNLEYNIEEGKRGKRYTHIKRLLREIAAAEDATAVNNNAAAVMLALSTLARGKEVVVSRGELVEIGGSFRIPDVMAQSGAVLREIGTTNKTHLKDYEAAIGPETALIMKVHQSNYKITGFTSDVSIEELVALGKRHRIPVMYDLGSGCLINLRAYGVGSEPVVKEVVESGVDIVTFSGDKLLGGPQAGIIAGKTEYVERMNKNPLARALRIDKMTLAGLEATLFDYADPDRAVKNIPTVRMLVEAPESIRQRAMALAQVIKKGVKTPEKARVEVIGDSSEAGGGSLPGVSLVSHAVSVRPEGMSPNRLEERLRKGAPAVIARIKEDALLLDARTIAQDEIETVAACLKTALGEIS
ncbi:MAG: L-seryl-tRNA(Sec) selenium transferase [Nitrospiraceae bacterium]|nr:L-seryl-tRNA(Sec) selenium transferase [Nitrospiraceae bacterium]